MYRQFTIMHYDNKSNQPTSIDQLYNEYDKAFDEFNAIVEDMGGEPVKHMPKTKIPLRKECGMGIVELWVINRKDN